MFTNSPLFDQGGIPLSYPNNDSVAASLQRIESLIIQNAAINNERFKSIETRLNSLQRLYENIEKQRTNDISVMSSNVMSMTNAISQLLFSNPQPTQDMVKQKQSEMLANQLQQQQNLTQVDLLRQIQQMSVNQSQGFVIPKTPQTVQQTPVLSKPLVSNEPKFSINIPVAKVQTPIKVEEPKPVEESKKLTQIPANPLFTIKPVTTTPVTSKPLQQESSKPFNFSFKTTTATTEVPKETPKQSQFSFGSQNIKTETPKTDASPFSALINPFAQKTPTTITTTTETKSAFGGQKSNGTGLFGNISTQGSLFEQKPAQTNVFGTQKTGSIFGGTNTVSQNTVKPNDTTKENKTETTTVPTKDGNDNEKVIYEGIAHLYNYIDGSISERGKGTIRVLVNSSKKSSRVVMRNDDDHKICANFPITNDMSIVDKPNRNNIGLVTAVEFCDDSRGVEQVNLFKFSTAAEYQKFKELFINCSTGKF